MGGYKITALLRDGMSITPEGVGEGELDCTYVPGGRCLEAFGANRTLPASSAQSTGGGTRWARYYPYSRRTSLVARLTCEGNRGYDRYTDGRHSCSPHICFDCWNLDLAMDCYVQADSIWFREFQPRGITGKALFIAFAIDGGARLYNKYMLSATKCGVVPEISDPNWCAGLSCFLAEDTLAAYSAWFSDPWGKHQNTPSTWAKFFSANDTPPFLGWTDALDGLFGAGFQGLAERFGWAHFGEPLSRYVLTGPEFNWSCALHDLIAISNELIQSTLTGAVRVRMTGSLEYWANVLLEAAHYAVGHPNRTLITEAGSQFKTNLLKSGVRGLRLAASRGGPRTADIQRLADALQGEIRR